ncbi:hypothetical protein BZL39_K00230 [Zygosaccharomyces parabailii]|nr:hypothetical protein BZL39_K00230 [Zygosaccharomyces parabailii]CDH18053.1 uncharacterized protein ZBAI_09841 [Zygosaccharomyces bailii ISA1307]
MPIVYPPFKKGFYLFTSEESLAKFKRRDFRKGNLDPNGVGVPLFHFKPKSSLVGSSKKPSYVIFKYILQNAKDSPPFKENELVNKDKHYRLYKIPFCQIYQQFDNVIRTYNMEFPFDFKTIRDYDFVNAKEQRGYCGSVQGYDLSWRVCNSRVDEHELYVDYANV